MRTRTLALPLLGRLNVLRRRCRLLNPVSLCFLGKEKGQGKGVGETRREHRNGVALGAAEGWSGPMLPDLSPGLKQDLGSPLTPVQTLGKPFP